MPISRSTRSPTSSPFSILLERTPNHDRARPHRCQRRVAVRGHYRPGLLDEVVRTAEGADSVAILYQPPLQATAEQVRAYLAERGFDAHRVEIPDAEAGRTCRSPHSVGMCAGGSGSSAMTRSSVLAAVRLPTWLASSVATWMRGIGVIRIPTTLLAMVDAAVGGKTGINTDAGKNLVGSFHEPDAVLIDIATLETVRPTRSSPEWPGHQDGIHRRPVILDLIEADPVAAVDTNGELLPELIRRSVRVKADVVSADLKESSLREILNYGHPGSRHRTARATAGATVPPCRSDWCSPRNWHGWRAASTTRPPTGTAPSWS